jgi:hypothetical protein
MVDCDRCHRKFNSYAALKQHYGNQHSNAKWPGAFETQLVEENNLQGYRVNPRPTHNSHARLVVAVILIVIVIGAASLNFTWFASISSPTLNASSTKTVGFNAAIIDQVGADLPNMPFVNEAENTLTSSGLGVKYFAAADATVDLYKRLPSLGYRLIVWRVHSAISNQGGLAPFTSEPYDPSKYAIEQLTGSLLQVTASFTPSIGPYYFGISTRFVAEEMEGNFNGTIIILSSCDGLFDHVFADALIRRGASAIISWNNLVTITHTDMATMVLLKGLAQGWTVSEAVQVAKEKSGPDPVYGSVLGFYPSNGGQLTVWSSASAQTNAQIASNLNGVFILSSKIAICFVWPLG